MLFQPAQSNSASTVSTVPAPALQNARRRPRKPPTMPPSTSSTPTASRASTPGISSRLFRYLYGERYTNPLSGMYANPTESNQRTSQVRKNSRKNPLSMNSRRRQFSRRVSSAIFPAKYRHASTRVSSSTLMPSRRFCGTSAASKPCREFAQTEITGMAGFATAALFTTNSAPVKKVPTAVPMSSGPRIPLSSRKTR